MKENLLRLFLICVMSVFTLGASALRGGETPDKNYLCFTANTAGSTVELVKSGNSTALNIAYSIDGTTWSDYTFGTVITLNDAGDNVYFRKADEGVASGFSTFTAYYYFSMTGSIAANGNVMSLIDQSCEALEIPCSYCFCRLFEGCTALTSAPELPATTLAERCYGSMFKNCTALVTAPKELPATELAEGCYQAMFQSCEKLTTAPELPAKALAESCYEAMFSQCTSLEVAPELPAETMEESCYTEMFYGCKNLTSAPKLPATTMAEQCYSNMFYNCTSLTSAPKLPATTMAIGCYFRMFSGCTSLKSAPELPAETLANLCYYYMFDGCTSLKSAPELPATTLKESCYERMFNGCTSLTTAPELPATTWVSQSGYYMFSGCTNLSNISVAFANWQSKGMKFWVNGVSSTLGTFICPEGLTKTYGTSNIPSSGWTVKNSYDLTITDVGWASMCVNLPLQIPTGVEVYYASAVEGSTISLTQIGAGTTIAPRTAVLVKGAAGTVSFPIKGEVGTSYTDNLFAGTSVDKAFDAGKDGAVYVLSGVGSTGNPQFQNYTGTTLGAHKIWLPKSAVGGTTGAINFVFDDATAINGTDVAAPKSTVRYNLNGQAVGADYKGIVIVNGKKMLNK